jgi:hypothetical protein
MEQKTDGGKQDIVMQYYSENSERINKFKIAFIVAIDLHVYAEFDIFDPVPARKKLGSMLANVREEMARAVTDDDRKAILERASKSFVMAMADIRQDKSKAIKKAEESNEGTERRAKALEIIGGITQFIRMSPYKTRTGTHLVKYLSSDDINLYTTCLLLADQEDLPPFDPCKTFPGVFRLNVLKIGKVSRCVSVEVEDTLGEVKAIPSKMIDKYLNAFRELGGATSAPGEAEKEFSRALLDGATELAAKHGVLPDTIPIKVGKRMTDLEQIPFAIEDDYITKFKQIGGEIDNQANDVHEGYAYAFLNGAIAYAKNKRLSQNKVLCYFRKVVHPVGMVGCVFGKNSVDLMAEYVNFMRTVTPGEFGMVMDDFVAVILALQVEDTIYERLTKVIKSQTYADLKERLKNIEESAREIVYQPKITPAITEEPNVTPLTEPVQEVSPVAADLSAYSDIEVTQPENPRVIKREFKVPCVSTIDMDARKYERTALLREFPLEGLKIGDFVDVVRESDQQRERLCVGFPDTIEPVVKSELINILNDWIGKRKVETGEPCDIMKNHGHLALTLKTSTQKENGIKRNVSGGLVQALSECRSNFIPSNIPGRGWCVRIAKPSKKSIVWLFVVTVEKVLPPRDANHETITNGSSVDS